MTKARERIILHVDDDPVITTLVADLLSDHGYKVDSLNDSRLALDKIKGGQYRVIIIGLKMPGVDGLQLLQQIKAYDGGIQVITLTSVDKMKVILKVMREGALACCFKPLRDPEMLLDAIERAFWYIDRWWAALSELSDRRKEVKNIPAAADL